MKRSLHQLRRLCCQQYFGTCINRFAQRFTRLEMRNAFFRDRDALARPWVTSHARRTAINGKAAKATNFDPVTTNQRIADRVKKGLHGVLSIAVRELAKSIGQLFY